jgi:hypothetical protein
MRYLLTGYSTVTMTTTDDITNPFSRCQCDTKTVFVFESALGTEMQGEENTVEMQEYK